MTNRTLTPGQILEHRLVVTAGFRASHQNDGTMTLGWQYPNRASNEPGTTMIWVSIAHDDGDRVTVIEFERNLVEANRTVFSRVTAENIQKIEWYIATLKE